MFNPLHPIQISPPKKKKKKKQHPFAQFSKEEDVRLAH